MGLDIRLPLGLVFAIIGGLLVLYGALTRGSAMYAASMGWNVNLIWGGFMMLFGAVMLTAAYLAARTAKRRT